jgi:hypothetical protein
MYTIIITMLPGLPGSRATLKRNFTVSRDKNYDYYDYYDATSDQITDNSSYASIEKTLL